MPAMARDAVQWLSPLEVGKNTTDQTNLFRAQKGAAGAAKGVLLLWNWAEKKAWAGGVPAHARFGGELYRW
jgi:hypothetical protein